MSKVGRELGILTRNGGGDADLGTVNPQIPMPVQI